MPSQFRFIEHHPDPRLRGWILNYWEFEVGTGAPASHHVPPDGCTSVLLALGPDGKPALVTSGPWTTPLVVPANPGQRTRGFRFAPGAAPGILGVAAEQLVNRVGAVPGAALLALDRIAAAFSLPTLVEMARELDTILVESLPQWAMPDPRVSHAVTLLWQGGGDTALPMVAERVGCSPRTLLRIVRQSTGLTPKQFARIVRFHSAARVIADGGGTLSQAAAEGGYADQPHFHHEVTALTGLTPAQLAQRVRETDYRDG